MDRFVSNFTNRVDAKGRVSIPAPFRAVLARDGFEGLYVHPALDAPALAPAACIGNKQFDGLASIQWIIAIKAFELHLRRCGVLERISDNVQRFGS